MGWNMEENWESAELRICPQDQKNQNQDDQDDQDDQEPCDLNTWLGQEGCVHTEKKPRWADLENRWCNMHTPARSCFFALPETVCWISLRLWMVASWLWSYLRWGQVDGFWFNLITIIDSILIIVCEWKCSVLDPYVNHFWLCRCPKKWCFEIAAAHSNYKSQTIL